MRERLRRLDVLKEEQRPSDLGGQRTYRFRIPYFLWLRPEVVPEILSVKQCGSCRTWVPEGNQVCDFCGRKLTGALSKAWRLNDPRGSALADMPTLIQADNDENGKYAFNTGDGRRRAPRRRNEHV